jgi:hypothetical protein
VRDHRQEFVLEPARFGVQRRAALRLLLLPPFGEIPRDLRESPRMTALVVQRRDDDVRPEALAVLPHAPSLVFETPVRGGRLQLGRWFVQVLRRVEDREVAADHLISRISLDPGCADVPRDDRAHRIEQEDRVVDHALDEELEPFLGFTQFAGGRRVGAGARSHVAGAYRIGASVLWSQARDVPQLDRCTRCKIVGILKAPPKMSVDELPRRCS